MTLGPSVDVLHCFVALVVWQSGPWCAFHVSGGTPTPTTIQCVLNNEEKLSSITCCADQWVHIISKKFQVGCPPTNSSYTLLQSNTEESLTVSCVGSQPQSPTASSSCPDLPATCLEHLRPPDAYSGNNTTVTVEGECVDESAIGNLCADLSDTTTDLLYLASPSLFLAPGPPPHTRCRCEIHAEHLGQVEILFADINTSMFTITCGRQIVSDGNFTTNVTNTVISLPDNSSDCVIDVDQRRADRTDGTPPHKMWTKLTGSSLTFRCNSYMTTSSSSLSSSSPLLPSSLSSSGTDTTMTMAPTTRPQSTSTSVSTVTSNTTTNETSEVTTTTNYTTPGNVTTSQTIVDTGTEARDGGTATVTYPYIIGGVVGGVVLVIIVVSVLIVIRRSKTIYDSLKFRNNGGQRDDDEHLYSRITPGGATSVQHTADSAAGQDQRPHGNQQSGVQGSNRENVSTAPSPGYENVAMTQLMEAASGTCQPRHQHVNVTCDDTRNDNCM